MNNPEKTGYDHSGIEKKWQQVWEEQGIYKVADTVEGKENFYQLVEFSYPSGNLHVGHWYAFSVPDIFARYKRMQGFNVLYPMGFDAFGLPAENAAIKFGGDPKVWTYEQMDKMRLQLRSMGAMFDWDREIVSCSPEYYKWTQWMFNQFLKHDLVYRAVTKVNWCPKDQTILANEQVTDNKCERCGSEVVQRDQEQWMLRITKYADRLIDDLDTLAWPHAIKEAQKNWIGRSEGSEIEFAIQNLDKKIKVFTTRADTLFGVTYVVLAPEHALVQELLGTVENKDEVLAYIADTKKKSELDRQQSKEKTGVQLSGVFAVNPANNEVVPVWIADYVLAGYGTGAVMAVPAHDERDFEFAKKYQLPCKTVIGLSIVDEGEDAPREGVETLNREVVDVIIENEKGEFLLIKETANGATKIHFVGGGTEGEPELDALKKEIMEETGYTDIEIIEKMPLYTKNFGFRYTKLKNQVTYGYFFHVKTISENRVPCEVEEGNHELMWVEKSKVKDLINWPHHSIAWNMFLSANKAMTDKGVLVNSGEFGGLTSEEARKKITEFVGGKMVSTYRLRDWGISRQRYWGTPIPIVYDPEGNAHPVPDEHLPWILPTDVDHTPDGTAPLARSAELLERTEKIFGKGWKPEVETMDTFVDSSWYFYRYLDNKNAEAFAETGQQDAWMPIDLYMGGAEHTTMHLLYSRFWTKALYDIGLVKDAEAYAVRRNRGLILGPDGNKMSKSKGNVIDPDEIVKLLGADTVRMYLAFMGPYGVTTNYPWDPNGVVGVRRFLERVWRMQNKIAADAADTAMLHKVIKKMTEDIEDFKFNTAISQMMILLNEWDKLETISLADYKVLLQLLAPFAPHMTEELWTNLGEAASIHLAPWPAYNPAKIIDEQVTLAVQINGKVRDTIHVQTGTLKEEVERIALASEKVQSYIAGAPIKKVIVVEGRVVNIVL